MTEEDENFLAESEWLCSPFCDEEIDEGSSTTTANPLEIYETIRADQRAEADMAVRRPMHVIGPYQVHLAQPGWYCVLKGGSVVHTATSATEAAFWAAMKEDA